MKKPKFRKAVFIDRDGVINRDPGGWTEHSYVTKWDDFYFLPEAKDAIKRLTDKGYDIVVVSNQAGVSKGYYTVRALNNINAKMLKEIKKAGGRITKVYYCIHKDEDGCGCRKPNTGMLDQAERELDVDVAGSYFIGDGKVDVEAGSKAGMKTVLVLSGKTTLEAAAGWDIKPDHIFADLSEAVDFIVAAKKKRE
ncbi:MAG: D-glycero-beta-D-manno-heptose 1,7-bisphosphate 7-phosphatase [Candidatus Omnitrophica bacterium]|nr:D-glycero-beta-D-manno-heptose 1,7-bisphosphate 7-phosphatase [Candidatus Omnitrophota bacterium]